MHEFLRFYAIAAHDTPKAVPTAARIADARFHRNFIILVLFSLVIFSTDLIPNFILARIITVFFFCPQIITDFHRLFFLGTEIRGFILNKDTAGSALIFSTALRDYGLLRKFTA